MNSEDVDYVKICFYSVTTCVGTLIIKWMLDYIRLIAIFSKIPGRQIIPFFGNTYVFLKNPSDCFCLHGLNVLEFLVIVFPMHRHFGWSQSSDRTIQESIVLQNMARNGTINFILQSRSFTCICRLWQIEFEQEAACFFAFNFFKDLIGQFKAYQEGSCIQTYETGIWRWFGNKVCFLRANFFFTATNYNILKMKSDGEKWVQNRKIMTPAFHFDILKKFFVVMNEKTNILLELLDKQANNGTSIDMKTYLKSFSLDVITGKKKLCALGHLNLKTL